MNCCICYGKSMKRCDECQEHICSGSSCHSVYKTKIKEIIVCSDCVYNIESKLFPITDESLMVRGRKCRKKHYISLLNELDNILNLNKQVMKMK